MFERLLNILKDCCILSNIYGLLPADCFVESIGKQEFKKLVTRRKESLCYIYETIDLKQSTTFLQVSRCQIAAFDIFYAHSLPIIV